MNPRVRDGLLAVAAVLGLLAVAARTATLDSLLRVDAAMVGILGSVVLELVFLRDPGQTLALWERPEVQLLSLLAVVALGYLAVQTTAVWLLAALLWGLLAYLGLLAVVVVTGKNPLAF